MIGKAPHLPHRAFPVAALAGARRDERGDAFVVFFVHVGAQN
jgi:hypothetical protein|tara:strand:+ start:396 stop:521 length:126 start_codon:yes stop_codon:yes gene_type:complete